MKSLLKYFKGYIKESIMGPLFKLLEALFELFIPLVVAGIIDKGIAQSDEKYIIKMVLLMLALGIIGLSCSLTAQFFSAKAAVGFSAKIREEMFNHIQTLSYTELDKSGSATMISRMTTDLNKLQDGVNMTLRLFLRSPFIVFGAAIMAYRINHKAAIIFLIVILALSLVIYGIMIITMPMYKKLQSVLDGILALTRDNINGTRLVRAFGLESNESDSFKEKNDIYVKKQIVVGRLAALTNPLSFAIINLGMVILVYKGAIIVDEGYISQGQLVALINYMSQILVELIKLSNFIVLDIKALASASRIEKLLLTKSDENFGKDILGKKPASVEFKNVSFIYEGAGEESLSDISFKADSGQIIGIIGGTGSGKTSIINLISCFYNATKGSVLIDGKDVKEYDFNSLRQSISIVPQKAVLLAGSIRKNIQMGNVKATDEEIFEALDMAMARDFVEEKEGKLDFELNAFGRNLSGGQRQRLTIARALVKKAGILILDDSFSALDGLTAASLRKNLMKLKNNSTCFILSQRSLAVMNADKILVLDDGKQMGFGNHDELLKTCDVYREIYESEYGSLNVEL